MIGRSRLRERRFCSPSRTAFRCIRPWMMHGIHCLVSRREYPTNLLYLIYTLRCYPFVQHLNDFPHSKSNHRYIIPLSIGFVSIVLRWIADFTCSSWSQTCRVGSDVLSHIYQVVFFFLVILASAKAKQLSEAVGRVKRALELLTSDGAGTKQKGNWDGRWKWILPCLHQIDTVNVHKKY